MAENPKASSNVNEFNRYLNNNIDTLKQKFTDFYHDPFPLHDLTLPEHTEHSLQYIYDIFNFSKYEANQELNQTLRSSLIDNLTSFQNLQPKDSTFDPEMAVQLLRYCIEHNDMFAVHYDKKKSSPEPAETAQPSKEEKDEPPKEIQPEVAEPPAEPVPPKSPKKESRLEEKAPEEMPSNPSNQFESAPQCQKQENTELIKRQLKDVFQFYCKQQQGLNPKSTFDNINHKCKTMNLGKFMTFALASNIVHSREKAYSEAKLDKGQIVSAFKKAAKGSREIELHTFLNILEQLKEVDPTIYQKMGLGEDGSKGKKKVIDNLKSIVLPFSTKEREGREVSPFGRVFIPKLTTHSGYHQQSLRDELSSRKLQATQKQDGNKFDSRIMMNNHKIQQAKNGEKIRYSLKLGQSRNQADSDINFLSKLITQEDNDQIFLRDYQLPKNKIKSQNLSTDNNRYRDESRKESSFSQNLGGLTARPKKAESFVLPSIIKRGGQTEVTSQRKSLGRPPRKGGPRVLLN